MKPIGFKPPANQPTKKILSPWEVALQQFTDQYDTVSDISELDDFITTLDLYTKLQHFYPSEEYKPADLVNVLSALNFKTAYHPVLKDWYWLIKPK